MKKKPGFNPFLVMVILTMLFALGRFTKPVYSATCTWTGNVSESWHNPGNWDGCGGGVPGASDDVVIPAGPDESFKDPLISQGSVITVNTITIGEDAQLTMKGNSTVRVNTWVNSGTLIADFDYSNHSSYISGHLATPSSGTFTNNASGIIRTTSSADVEYYSLWIYITFNNNGRVELNGTPIYEGGLTLRNSGNHSGFFGGYPKNGLAFGDGDSSTKVHNFYYSSWIEVPKIGIAGPDTVNIYGVYDPDTTGSLLINCTGAQVVFKDTASAYFPELVRVYYGALVLEDDQSTYEFNQLKLFEGALYNKGQILVADSFEFSNSMLHNDGKTTISVNASGNMFAGTINQQELNNYGTINWGSDWVAGGTIIMSNGAAFHNYGTFNANNSSMMSGAAPAVFHNHSSGTFHKFKSGTTTTMNIDFANEGKIEVNSGKLIFSKALTTGDGTVIELSPGGAYQGDLTLAEGASLVGSGTLDGDLVNAGTVSPGTSPGGITITGDYTQEETGVLSIELAGTEPASEYDQLHVTGSAVLAGTLDVTLIVPFVPPWEHTFTIMTYGSRSGEFSAVNLPDIGPDLEWSLTYEDTALLLVMPPAPKTFIFLPLIKR